MRDMKSDDPWFIARDGQQHGPLNESEMKLFVERGHLRATDLLWRQGFPDWRPAFSVFPPKTQPTQPKMPTGAQPPQQSQPTTAPRTEAGIGTAGAATSKPAPNLTTLETAPAKQDVATPSPNQPNLHAHPSPGANAPHHGAGPFEAAPQIEITDSPSGRGKAIAAILSVSVLAGAGLWVYVNGLPDVFNQAGTSSTSVPVVKAPNTADATQKQAKAAPPPPAPAKVDIDQRLQQGELWQFLKTEYPNWYASVLKNAGQLEQDDSFERKLSELLVSRIIELRRQNAEKVLSAGPQNLTEVATTFLNNLKHLSGQGAEPCFTFISKGEASPSVIEAMRNPTTDAPIFAQLLATFKASVAGSKAPVKRESPQKSDYQALTSQLAKIGWNKEDIQLFANPKALSQAPPDRVCQMVQDWFTAHLNLENAETQERLLHETLKPVVAG